MCGLVGVAGDLMKKHEDMLSTLLLLDSLRGYHSTGVAFVKPQGNTSIVKTLGSGFEMIKHPDFKKNLLSKNCVIMGHNRYATIGAVTVDNAHPFEYNGVIGAHNGTLNNKYVLEGGSKLAVDSQALINHISLKGIDSAIENLSGAWALTLWDRTVNKLYFLRNSERPLFVAYTKDLKVIAWASEQWMLEQAAWRSDVELLEICRVKENTLYTINLDGFKLGAVERRECKSFFFAPVTQNKWLWDYEKGTYVQDESGYRKFEPLSAKEAEEQKKPANNVVHLPVPQDNKLIGAKGLVANVVGQGVESGGNRYLLLAVEDHESEFVRLYIHAKDNVEEYLGESVVVDIHDKLFKNLANGSTYMKALYSTHIIIEKSAEIRDHNGNTISKEDFQNIYGTECNWCSVSISPEEGKHYINASKALLCNDCKHNEEVRQYVH